MPRSLSGKLVAALVILLGVVGAVYVGLTLISTRLHIQEINQSLNRSLAANIVETKALVRESEVDPQALDEVFEMLMHINPAIEVYLLDPEGRILAYSAPPGKVKRTRVALDPIKAFLAGRRLPIRGDDPRDKQDRNVFSAAPVREAGRLAGYLYVVLGGEAYDTIAGMLERSHILRLSLGTFAVSVLVVGAAGILSFNGLTRRLRRLAQLMEELRRSGFRRPVDVPRHRFRERGDEIDRLGRTFDEMARRIVDQLAQLEHADASRRQLFANISHDLRTPLASLHGTVETLLMKGADLPEGERRRYLNLALKHSDHLSRLTDELFELATLESGDRALRREPFSMAELVQDVAQKFRHEADRRRLHMETEIPQQAAFVSADIGLIERVFENLMENALKYTPDGGTVRLSVIPGQEWVSARVADTGRGIPPAELAHVFERTYRTDKERGERPRGTGLGLAIARQILQLHGGSIEVESAVGAGTAFTFSLPLGDERAPPGPQAGA